MMINSRRFYSGHAVPQGLSSIEQEVVGLVSGSRTYGADMQLENVSSNHPSFRAAGTTILGLGAIRIFSQLYFGENLRGD